MVEENEQRPVKEPSTLLELLKRRCIVLINKQRVSQMLLKCQFHKEMVTFWSMASLNFCISSKAASQLPVKISAAILPQVAERERSLSVD